MIAGPLRPVKCSFCGFEFTEDEAAPSCTSCSLNRSCGKLCCPNCGYEHLPEPGLVRLIRERRDKNRGGTNINGDDDTRKERDANGGKG